MKTRDILRSIKLGKYFNALEFCNSKDGYACKVPHSDLFDKLDKLREQVGSVTITSGYRTPSFNRKVGGSPNSNHVKGLAADVKFNFSGWTLEKIRNLCVEIGFNNIGIYRDKDGSFLWLHLDVARRWNESNGWRHYGNSAVKLYYPNGPMPIPRDEKSYIENGLYIEEVDPKDIRGYRTKNGTIPEGNCINGSFVHWYDSGKTRPYALTPLVANGEHIWDYMDPKFKGGMPLFVVYKDGRVGVEVGSTKGRKDILLACGGVGLSPLKFTGFSSIGNLVYKTHGRIAIGWNEQTKRVVFIATKEKMTLYTFANKCKTLGFKCLLGLDSGGSAIWRFKNSQRLTTRKMALFFRWR